jgi:cytochrome c55X
MRRAVLLFMLSMALPVQADPDAMRQVQLLTLLRQDCGACHGMTLKGGLGPSLLPQALAGKTPDYLRQTILDGRGGTPMPPWRGMLSNDEVTWLVDQLRHGVVDAR